MTADGDDDELLGAFEVPAEDAHPATIAARLMLDDEHVHLADNDITFLWLMRTSPEMQGGRSVLARVQEPLVQGKLRDLFFQMLVATYGVMPDFIVTVDRDWWRDAAPIAREALVWHELCHVKQVRDKFGELKFDRDGKPVIGLIAHDIEEFRSTVARYGAWKNDIAEFIAAVRAD